MQQIDQAFPGLDETRRVEFRSVLDRSSQDIDRMVAKARNLVGVYEYFPTVQVPGRLFRHGLYKRFAFPRKMWWRGYKEVLARLHDYLCYKLIAFAGAESP